MYGARALDLTSSELTLLLQRSERPTGSHHDRQEGAGRIRRIVTGLRRALARAAEAERLVLTPRLSRYPY